MAEKSKVDKLIDLCDFYIAAFSSQPEKPAEQNEPEQPRGQTFNEWMDWESGIGPRNRSYR